MPNKPFSSAAIPTGPVDRDDRIYEPPSKIPEPKHEYEFKPTALGDLYRYVMNLLKEKPIELNPNNYPIKLSLSCKCCGRTYSARKSLPPYCPNCCKRLRLLPG